MHIKTSTIEKQVKIELKEYFNKEEIFIEKRINIVSLVISSFFLVFALLLPVLTSSSLSNPNVISNLTAVFIYMTYNLVLFLLLRNNFYHVIIKYFTIFIGATSITVAVFGYNYGVDFVHTTRTITIITYFLVIIISGLYRSPGLCIFAGVIVCAEYSFLFFSAFCSGLPVSLKMETFRQNLLTWDILAVYIAIFSASGVLMYIQAKRHKLLIYRLEESLANLSREKKDREKNQARAEFLEYYDELTRLPNYKLFRSRLESHLQIAEARNQTFAVMCIGMDSFRHINNLYGQEAGNLLLQETGRRLTDMYRKDDLVCRFMGDKFLVLFPDMKSTENTSHLVQKTQLVFDRSFDINETPVKVTACAGICSFPIDALSPDELIKKSESAMYEAKNLGKNKILLFNKKKQSELEETALLEKAMESALRNNEFFLLYQPKVDGNGEISGLECLARWENPEMGCISPERFIPLAEKSGLIDTLGIYVFSRCCGQIAEWTKKGIKQIPITINVSPYQLALENIVDQIASAINSARIDPGWLGIEITESSIIFNEAEGVEKLRAVKKLGLSISIDDFGKGYSSLSRLGTYPVDTLKIDKSFVEGLPESEISQLLVNSIIDLGHNLKYQVVAEGVENVEQLDYLKKNGCDFFQGYYFYKPLESEDIEKLLL